MNITLRPSFCRSTPRLLTAGVLAGAIILSSPVWALSPLTVAQREIGRGETGGNNRGQYVRLYLNGRDHLPWCAGFISYCFREAGYNLPYLLRAKSFLKYGKKTDRPRAGDLMVFSRKGGGHVEIIESVSATKITTIAGNVGDFPSRVKRISHNKNHVKNLLSYVRIKK